ncbi:MAG: dihydroorotase [Chitinophagales bacterium]|nr:dihydroorotase [Chitinophagales bacterium]MDW8419623.1 dihydroorotase [Chitinophagales bacterium]
MDILLRAARIVNSSSPHHLQVRDIHICDGQVVKIARRIDAPSRAKEIALDNLHICPGLVCLQTYLADPGYEHHETIESGCMAAAAGGYTHVCAVPLTKPVTQTKALIEYVLRKSADLPVQVHPLGAITENAEGKDLTEMFDMHHAGAVAFSDGWRPSPPAGVVERALLYAKAFDGLIMLHPEDKSISKNGVMHEGVVSTKLGLPAMPAIAEEIAVHRDLFVLEYTQSKLHFSDISLKRSVEFIRAAKKKGARVSASVNFYNLLLTDEAVGQYQTHCKVNPPLREQSDVTALIKGLDDGTIDAVCSAHLPQDEDSKKTEFDKAGFGMIGLETCFAATHTVLRERMPLEKIISVLSENPARIIGLKRVIDEGEPADLCLFDPAAQWTFTEKHIRSKSRNTPFIGYTFTGKPYGIIHRNQIVLNNY